MAKNLSKLLKAQMPSSPKISNIAELVRRHGRGRDTVLAHITPKEAALLKARGGRGSRNPHTGLLEFDDFTDFTAPTTFSETPANFTAPSYTPDVVTQAPTTYSGPDYTFNPVSTQAGDTFSQTSAPYFDSFVAPTQTNYAATPSNYGSFDFFGNYSGPTSPVVQQPQVVYSGPSNAVISNYPTQTAASVVTPADLATTPQSDQYADWRSTGAPTSAEKLTAQATPLPTGAPTAFSAAPQFNATTTITPAPAAGPTPSAAPAPTQEVPTILASTEPYKTNVEPGATIQGSPTTPDTSTPTSDPTKFVAKAGQDANDAASISSKTGNTGQAVNQLMAANGIDVTKNPQLLPQMTAISDGLKNGTITVAQAGQMMQNIANNQTLSGSVSNWLSQPANQFKMAIGLAGAAFGALMYNNQVNQAKQVQAQIQAASANASSQLQQLAQPILSQVNYGPTASDIQNIQAAQAQAAQASANAGSVGAAQQQRSIQDYVTRLADNRMQQNLQLMGAASPYLTSAINTNLQGVMSGLQTSLGIQQQAQNAVGNFAAGLARLFV